MNRPAGSRRVRASPLATSRIKPWVKLTHHRQPHSHPRGVRPSPGCHNQRSPGLRAPRLRTPSLVPSRQLRLRRRRRVCRPRGVNRQWSARRWMEARPHGRESLCRPGRDSLGGEPAPLSPRGPLPPTPSELSGSIPPTPSGIASRAKARPSIPPTIPPIRRRGSPQTTSQASPVPRPCCGRQLRQLRQRTPPPVPQVRRPACRPTGSLLRQTLALRRQRITPQVPSGCARCSRSSSPHSSPHRPRRRSIPLPRPLLENPSSLDCWGATRGRSPRRMRRTRHTGCQTQRNPQTKS